MKYILLALLAAISTQARADALSIAPSKDGGSLIIMSYTCPNRTARMVTETNSGGSVIGYACASMLTDDLIFIEWSNKKTLVLPTSDFLPIRRKGKNF